MNMVRYASWHQLRRTVPDAIYFTSIHTATMSGIYDLQHLHLTLFLNVLKKTEIPEGTVLRDFEYAINHNQIKH